MPRAVKPAGDAPREMLSPPDAFAFGLGALPDAATGLWRLCRNKGCRRAGCCRGGPDGCAEQVELMIEWLRAACRAGCAGLSPRAAAGVADRQVLAMQDAKVT